MTELFDSLPAGSVLRTLVRAAVLGRLWDHESDVAYECTKHALTLTIQLHFAAGRKQLVT